jgi:hypothetical protein
MKPCIVILLLEYIFSLISKRGFNVTRASAYGKCNLSFSCVAFIPPAFKANGGGGEIRTHGGAGLATVFRVIAASQPSAATFAARKAASRGKTADY